MAAMAAGVTSLLWEEQIRSERVPFEGFLLWPEQHPWHSAWQRPLPQD